MSALLITVHIIVCIALIMIVLLQTGKGADMGAAFGGGGSQTLFGSTGASTFLSTATTWAAIIFMFTCLTLAYISSHKTGSSIMKDAKVPAQEQSAPAEETKAPETASPAQTSAETKIGDEKPAADKKEVSAETVPAPATVTEGKPGNAAVPAASQPAPPVVTDTEGKPKDAAVPAASQPAPPVTGEDKKTEQGKSE